MKVRIDLDNGETLEKAEDFLEKSLRAKKECSHTEQYIDPAMNEFHDRMCNRHEKLVESIIAEIKAEIINNYNAGA